jgi:hypothetical protein
VIAHQGIIVECGSQDLIVQLVQEVNKQSRSSLNGPYSISSKQSFSGTNRAQVDVDRNIVSVGKHRGQVPQRMCLSSPSPTVDDLVINCIQRSSDPGVLEGRLQFRFGSGLCSLGDPVESGINGRGRGHVVSLATSRANFAY